MKAKIFTLGIALFAFGQNLLAQTSSTGRLFVPFLDKESQSNIIVTVCNFGDGEICPIEYTNTLSNTNLLTPNEQKLLRNIFVKYKNFSAFTTNSGPSGTVLAKLYETNISRNILGRAVTTKNWIAWFQYTNFDAQERLVFGSHSPIAAHYFPKNGNGYGLWAGKVGNDWLMQLTESKDGVANGLHASFTDSVLDEYWHYTNGMVFGNFLMWNPRNNNLILKADFKKPYDFEKHRIDLREKNLTRQP